MDLDPAALLATDRRLRALARGLVGDGGGADDLAQEAWLASLERPATIESFPAWLATVARRLAGRGRRGRARRSAREQVAARAEAIPSTADILEREEARQRVVAAVRGLEEPLRTTLVLRFLEDLPPRAVAARMSVPVETVRTRTKRGLELLRARLDAEFGGRERWMPAAIALARRPRAPLGTTIAALSLLTKLAVSVTVLALAFWLVWRSGGGPSDVGSAPTAPFAGSLERSTELAAEGETDRARADAAPRTDPPAASSALPGVLRVQVRWAKPLPPSGVLVRVASLEVENPLLSSREVATDDLGVARFDRLSPGQVEVRVDRDFGTPRVASIAAGAVTDVVVHLGLGFDVAGIAVDEDGRPVAGAGIWFGREPDLAHGWLCARSGADGTFRVPSVTHAYLGARAPAFRPSRIEHLLASSGSVIEVRLVLRSGGGEIRGSVRSPDGGPVAGALVRAGPAGPSSSTELDEDWGVLARTDERGLFEASGLAHGACPVLIRAHGFSTWRDEIDVPEGGSATLLAALAPEAALEGHVRDSRGLPVAGVEVIVGDDDGPFRASSRTRPDGSYRVGALEADRLLAARVQGDIGSARTEFQSRAGRSEVWEAVLESAGTIRGRVLDERGQPLAGWSVHLESQEPPPLGQADGHRLTLSDGRFEFERVQDRAHLVTVTAGGALASSLQRFDVRPSSQELQLRIADDWLPSVRIVGAVLDEQGLAVPGSILVPRIAGSVHARVGYCDPASGRFDLGPLPAGTVTLHVEAPGRGHVALAPRPLLPNETWDVGEIRLQAEGRLRLRLVAVELEPSDELELAVDAFTIADPFDGSGAERLSAPLAPGPHVVRLGGGRYAELARPFEIRSDAETALDLPLRRGWRSPVAFRAPVTAGWVDLRVTGPDGAMLERRIFERRDGLLVGSLRLAAGTYAVEAEAGTLRARGTLIVTSVDREDPVLVLDLE